MHHSLLRLLLAVIAYFYSFTIITYTHLLTGITHFLLIVCFYSNYCQLHTFALFLFILTYSVTFPYLLTFTCFPLHI